MAPYQPDTISRQDGINPWGIIIFVLIFVSVAAVMSWYGNKHHNFPSGANESQAIIASQNGHGVSPAVPVIDSKPEDVGISSDDSDAEGSTLQVSTSDNSEKNSAILSKETESPTTQKMNKQSTRRSNVTAVREPPEIPESKISDVNSSGSSDSKPSALITQKDIRKRAETGLPENIEKVSKKTIKSGPVEWYAVFVGYTDSRVRAEVLKEVLVNQGFTEAKAESDGDGYFYVNVGKFQFRYEADLAAKTVAGKTGLSPRIYEKTIAD